MARQTRRAPHRTPVCVCPCVLWSWNRALHCSPCVCVRERMRADAKRRCYTVRAPARLCARLYALLGLACAFPLACLSARLSPIRCHPTVEPAGTNISLGLIFLALTIIQKRQISSIRCVFCVRKRNQASSTQSTFARLASRTPHDPFDVWSSRVEK